MGESYNKKIGEAYSSIAKSSIKPILLRVSENLIFLPSFLIFTLTLTLILLPDAFSFQRLAILGVEIPDPSIQNFIIHIYLPILITNFILIIIGLILNLNKRLIIKLGYSKRDITKRSLNSEYQIHNTSKRHFKVIHLPIAVFITYTGILTIISNSLNSDKIFNFVIQNYIPVVILCWIAFMVLFLVSSLRKKLRNVEIKRF